MVKYNLSKSQYCRGKRCLKSIWLYKNRKDLIEDPSDFKAILFRQGHEVGELAQTYFENGVLIAEGLEDIQAALDKTEKALKNKVPYIYEGAFLYDGILIRADIVECHSDGTLSLIEVKSTNEVKSHHVDDVAIQKYVLTKLGFEVKSSHLMHLNRNYVRENKLDIKSLFTIFCVDDDVEHVWDEVENYLEKIRNTIFSESEPTVTVGSKCNSPYGCDFKKYCWKKIEIDSIHNLTRIKEDKRLALVEMGISKVQDIPLEAVKLSSNQMVQRQAAIEKSVVIDKDRLNKHIDQLRFPLYFLDYESVSYAIPPYAQTRPYLHLPFQYSLHVLHEPNGELSHFEFIHTEATDPRRALAKSLVGHITDDGGSVIVYHASYEKSRTEELAEIFPDLSDRLKNINSRFWDLEIPFAKRWYYDWRFGKSSSIKVVLPVLCPELSYKDLSIQDGGTASVKYMDMINSSNRKQVSKDLLAYCKLDTLAMVNILKELEAYEK